MILNREYNSAIVRKTKGKPVVYSYEILVKIIMNKLKLDKPSASEWVDYNLLGYKDDTWDIIYLNK